MFTILWAVREERRSWQFSNSSKFDLHPPLTLSLVSAVLGLNLPDAIVTHRQRFPSHQPGDQVACVIIDLARMPSCARAQE